jgi:hypothetical protein
MGILQTVKKRMDANKRMVQELKKFREQITNQNPMKNSKKYSFNKEDGQKILKGAGIALGGALLTYLLTIVGDVDFGQYTPMVVGVLSILINAGLKFINDKK